MFLYVCVSVRVSVSRAFKLLPKHLQYHPPRSPHQSQLIQMTEWICISVPESYKRQQQKHSAENNSIREGGAERKPAVYSGMATHIFCSIELCVEINICKAQACASLYSCFWDAKWGSRSSVFPSNQTAVFSSYSYLEREADFTRNRVHSSNDLVWEDKEAESTEPFQCRPE